MNAQRIRVTTICALLPLFSACPAPHPTGGCTDTCEFAGDGECDDGGEDSLYAACDLGTDCRDCGDRGGGPGEPAPPVDYGIPAEFPQLSARHLTRAFWRHDDSGFETVPNLDYTDVSEIPVSEGLGTSPLRSNGEAWQFQFTSTSENTDWTIVLRTAEVGAYEATGFDAYAERVEHRGGSFAYTSEIAGGGGSVEVVGNNGTAIWGLFTVRQCFRSTPNVNCFVSYEGRFSTLL